jgi:hypothetical protein
MLTLLVHVDALGKLKEKVVKLKEGRWSLNFKILI